MSPTAKSSKKRPFQPCLTVPILVSPSRDHDDLAEEIPRFHESFSLAQFGERKGAHLRLLDLALRNFDHAAGHVVLGIAVRSANLHFPLPDVANIRARVEAGRGPAGQQFAVRLERPNGWIPGVAAGEIDADVHAILAADAPCLAGKIVRAVIDSVVG